MSKSEDNGFLTEKRLVVPVGREALWELLADTDRLNREIGLPPVRFTFSPRPEGGSTLYGESTMYGITSRYREDPYSWVRPREWSVQRVYDRGPVRSYTVGMRFKEASSGSTAAHLWLQMQPRGAHNTPLARAVAADNLRRLVSACVNCAEFLSRRAATPYPRHSGHPAVDAVRLEAAITTLLSLGVQERLARRMEKFLSSAPPEDVVNVRPFALADRWGEGRREVLHACLLAVRAQMLELRWRVLCPACRGAGEAVPTLESLGGKQAEEGIVHCPSCNIRFGPEFDRSVEVCFSVAPRIRAAGGNGEATYCVGGPGRSPHIALQCPLASGEVSEIVPDLPPREYLAASPQASASVPLLVEEGDGKAAFRIVACEAGVSIEKMQAVRIVPPLSNRLTSRGIWQLHNETPWPVLFRLEVPGWHADVATAALVTSLQEFRDRFGSEVLSPGTELAVRQITILFSDLKSSTEMYARQGDAPSYAAVREHFAFLSRVIARHEGGIVKTIGDAVMAVFTDPAQGVAAALDIQREMAEQDTLTVKLGLFAGGALAVNANGVLDYFGQAVNLAARVQSLSVGGDVVIPASLADDPKVASLLHGVAVEPFAATLRGTDQALALVRLWVDVSATQSSPVAPVL